MILYIITWSWNDCWLVWLMTKNYMSCHYWLRTSAIYNNRTGAIWSSTHCSFFSDWYALLLFMHLICQGILIYVKQVTYKQYIVKLFSIWRDCFHLIRGSFNEISLLWKWKKLHQVYFHYICMCSLKKINLICLITQNQNPAAHINEMSLTLGLWFHTLRSKSYSSLIINVCIVTS